MIFMSMKLLEIHEIQQMLGIGRNKVYALLQSGEIEAFKIGREWKVTDEAVEAYIAKLRGNNINNIKYGSDRISNKRF